MVLETVSKLSSWHGVCSNQIGIKAKLEVDDECVKVLTSKKRTSTSVDGRSSFLPSPRSISVTHYNTVLGSCLEIPSEHINAFGCQKISDDVIESTKIPVCSAAGHRPSNYPSDTSHRGINDASRGLRRAAGAAGDVLDGAAGTGGQCFKPGTLVHRMASDPQAVLALLAEELSTEEHDESLIWWILTGIAAVTVALAVANERRRHTGNKHNVSHALATAKIDELFSSNGLWEPQSWKEAEPESELAAAL